MTNALIWLGLGVLLLVSESRAIERAQRRLGFMRLLGGGWTILVLGVAIGPEALGIVDSARLANAQPALLVLLTWCGAIIGLQCRPALIKAIPHALWRWIAYDYVISLICAVAAAALLSRIWQPENELAAQVMLIGVVTTIGIGWNPETRSLGIRTDAGSNRLAMLVQAGAGMLAILSVITATVSLQAVEQVSGGDVHFARWGGALAMLMEIAAVFVVSLGSIAILRDSREDDARTTLVVIGALALLSGIAVSFGGSGLFGGLLFGMAVACSRRRLKRLESFIGSSEPIIASGCFLFAGLMLELPSNFQQCAGIVAIAVLIAVSRRILKPLVMDIALRKESASLAPDAPAMRAPIRQAPLTIVILMAFVAREPSGLVAQLLCLAVLIALFAIVLAPARANWKGGGA